MDSRQFSGSTPAGGSFLHANGENVIQQDAIGILFDALDLVRGLPEYDSICSQSDHEEDGVTTCRVEGITTFWNNSKAIYQDSVNSHEDLIEAVSAPADGRGRPVDLEFVVGHPTYEADGVTVASGKSSTVLVQLPEIDGVLKLEQILIDALLEFQKEVADQDTVFQMEIKVKSSVDEEAYRAIVKDLPLIPLAFAMMSTFTCSVFFKRDPIQSRCWMGFGAVVTVVLAIMSGYGLLFCIGVPLTSMTQILPFVMFGIGLDGAFIITGEYGRTDSKKDPVERIDETVGAVGLSIALTTSTSVLAFGLGSMSSIPAIFWLCYYAFPTLIICFLYQITFFVAVIVIDEQRIRESRRDCCFCQSGHNEDDTENSSGAAEDVQLSTADRVMLRYADFILRPWVKAVVLVVFGLMLAGFSYSTSLLKQEFKLLDILPSDSYLVDFVNGFDAYYSKGIVFPVAYFRNVDQSDPEIQNQMIEFVNELSTIDAIGEPPMFFWLKHFRELQANYSDYLVNMTFNEQMDLFLQVPVLQELYGRDIMRNENGDIESSRVLLYIDDVDINDVKNQMSIMEDQRAVTEAQPINQGRSEWPFFNYEPVYNIWAFYGVAVNELVLTTIIGVAAVTGVALLFVPHWTACLFVLPLISILYIDLLGFLQMCGAQINAVSYVSMVMSIGLMVDYMLHVLLRYYECEGGREDKVRETLRTMGSSIMMGALSTFLGIIPLGFSSSMIIKIIFYAFIGLVVLGAGHGLILLPVVLSIIGPEECIRHTQEPVKENPTSQSPAIDASASKEMVDDGDSQGIKHHHQEATDTAPTRIETDLDC